MEEQGPSQRMLEEVMARCDVLCSPKPLELFRGSKEGAIKVGHLVGISITWGVHCRFGLSYEPIA